MKFENGDLVVEHKKQIANISNLEYYDLEKIIPSPGLSLITKLNLEKNKEKLEEHLQELAEAVGNGEWALEVDFLSIVPQLDSNTQERVGDIYYQNVLHNLVSKYGFLIIRFV